MGSPRSIVALVAASGLLVACAVSSDTELGAGEGGAQADGGASGNGGGGAGGDPAGGGGGQGATPGLRLAFSTGAADLVPGSRIDAWIEKDGERLADGVTWTLEPDVGLGDRMGRVATGIGLGGCAACLRLGGIGLEGVSLPTNDFARFRLEGAVGGEIVRAQVRLHPVHASTATPDGRVLAASTRLEGSKLGERGFAGPGSLFFAASSEADADGFVPLSQSFFVEHEGTLTRLEDRGAAGGRIVALGLVDGGTAIVALGEGEAGALVGTAQAADALGLERIEAASTIVSDGCGEFIAVVSAGKAWSIDASLGGATEAAIGSLPDGAVALRVFAGADAATGALAFVLADDGAIHPFTSSSCADALANEGAHSCLEEYTNRAVGPLEDAVYVGGHLYGRGKDRETYLGQGTAVCSETASGGLERGACVSEPGPLAAGVAWAWEASGVCGFGGLQLKSGEGVLATVPACEVCGFAVNEEGAPKGGAPLDVQGVRSLVDAEGKERLVVQGTPAQGLRVVVREPTGDCPITCP